MTLTKTRLIIPKSPKRSSNRCVRRLQLTQPAQRRSMPYATTEVQSVLRFSKHRPVLKVQSPFTLSSRTPH